MSVRQLIFSFPNQSSDLRPAGMYHPGNLVFCQLTFGEDMIG